MTKEAPQQVADNLVVSLDYILIVEDEELESTADTGPIQFIQGSGQILPSLEDALYDMRLGETKTIQIPAAEAYGIIDPAAIHKANQSEFAIDIPLNVGTFLELRDDDDNVLSAQIIAKDEDTITLDFNHPLAGQDLMFKTTVVGLHQATEEELEYEHMH